MSEKGQFDVLRATIMEAVPRRSVVSDVPWVNVRVTLDEPYMYCGVEVEGLYVAVVNEFEWKTSMLRAELRCALGLEPVVFNKTLILGVPVLLVPIFEEGDLQCLVGKKVRVVVISQQFEGMERLRIKHFLPLEGWVQIRPEGVR